MPQEQQKEAIRFQNKQSKEPSATCWTNLSAGEFLIDLQDFCCFAAKRLGGTDFSRIRSP